MPMKALVTAASRHHATDDIADAIATGLRDREIDAESRRIEEVSDVDSYGAVVLGSAVYLGRWLPEARRFATIHASALSSMPVWLFSSGPVGPPDHLVPPGEAADVPVLRQLTRARGHRTFPGRLDMKGLHFTERAMARTIHAPDGDSRDWEAVEGFAGEIADALLHPRLVA